MLRTIAIMLLCSFTSTALGQGPKSKEPKVSLDEKWVRSLGENFAFDYYRATLAGREKQSFCCSPYSAMAALAMLSHGASGDARDEFAKLWPASKHPSAEATKSPWSSDRLLTGLRSLQETLQSPRGPKQDGRAAAVELDIANAIWVEQSFPLKPSLLEGAKKYGAVIEAADFAGHPAQQIERINTWCKEKTRGKIPKVLGPEHVTPDTRLMLVNAVYFNAAWAEPFEKQRTKEGKFSLLDGRIRMRSMMSDFKETRYAEFRPDGSINEYVLRDKRVDGRRRNEWQLPENPEGWRILELPYKGNRFSIVLILSNKLDGITEIENKLDRERIDYWLRKLDLESVFVSIPRFKVESNFDLTPILKSLGLHAIFSPGNLLNFSDSPEASMLSVYPAIQKAYIDVNEEGTEAAAVTALGAPGGVGGPSKPPPEFIADHPFLFLIRDNQTGAILFIGRFTGEE